MQALMERLNTERLPRALQLKAKVDAGGRLDDQDLRFLESVFDDAHAIKPLMDRHPEYQDLAVPMIDLYKHITQRALENEQKR